MKSCVQCGYSLRGLPARHECPECGLAYDDLSEIWKNQPNRRLITSVALLSLGWIGMTYYFSTSLRGSALPPAVRLILQLGFALLFVYLALRFWRLFRGRQFVATMPGGLHFRSDAKGTVIIDWSNISRVAVISRGAVKPSPPGAVIFLKREKMVRDIIGPFRKRAEAEEFVRHVEARLASAGAET